ncbi:MAG: hypothetical protein ACJ8BW_17795 [Ktedonobacteraceae bacterium]
MSATITATREDPLPPDWPGVWFPVFLPVVVGALVGLAPGICAPPIEATVAVVVGDTLIVALGDAPVVGDTPAVGDETGGRVERDVGDGLGVDVLVGEGDGVVVAVDDDDGLGVGD